MKISDIRHGDQIWVRDFNPISLLIQNAQGDFEWSHICSAWFLDGQWWILTTGAYWDWKRLGFVFGRVPLEKYLSTREWTAQRRTDLTEDGQEARLQTLLNLESRMVTYALAKVAKLATWRLKSGVADKLHDPPELFPTKSLGVPTKVFCAEAEALGLIAGIREDYLKLFPALDFHHAHKEACKQVNRKYPQKIEACVHTPETLFDAAESIPV